MHIRHADPARDAAACASIYGPYVRDTAISFEHEPPGESSFAQRMERTDAHSPLAGGGALRPSHRLRLRVSPPRTRCIPLGGRRERLRGDRPAPTRHRPRAIRLAVPAAGGSGFLHRLRRSDAAQRGQRGDPRISSASSPSVCTARSATSTADGGTSAGGSSSSASPRTRRRANRPRHPDWTSRARAPSAAPASGRPLRLAAPGARARAGHWRAR